MLIRVEAAGRILHLELAKAEPEPTPTPVDMPQPIQIYTTLDDLNPAEAATIGFHTTRSNQ